MFYEQKYRIQISDTRRTTNATNKGFLGLLEDIASLHSSEVGYGIYDMKKTGLTWLLLDWRLHVIKRPQFEELVNVKTWSRKIEKYYAYRDFEIRNKNGELLAVATSKWILIDTKIRKVTKVDETVEKAYENETEFAVFKDEKLDKLKEPQNFISSMEYKLQRRDIDIYNHMHNLYYLDLAYEILPDEIYERENEFNDIRITYKREIKPNSIIKCMYSKENGKDIVVIKSNDGSTLHSIIEMW